jgi:hypothetical protein
MNGVASEGACEGARRTEDGVFIPRLGAIQQDGARFRVWVWREGVTRCDALPHSSARSILTTPHAGVRSGIGFRYAHMSPPEKMMKSKWSKSLLIALAMTLSIGFASQADADSRTMGQTRAGQYYLNSVCPENAVFHTFIQKVWRGENTISWRELRRRLGAIEYQSRQLGKANHRMARALYNPPAAWPSSVAGPVTHLADAEVKTAGFAFKMGGAATARGWARYWSKYRDVPFHHYSETIRARLDLPPPGKGC